MSQPSTEENPRVSSVGGSLSLYIHTLSPERIVTCRRSGEAHRSWCPLLALWFTTTVWRSESKFKRNIRESRNSYRGTCVSFDERYNRKGLGEGMSLNARKAFPKLVLLLRFGEQSKITQACMQRVSGLWRTLSTSTLTAFSDSSRGPHAGNFILARIFLDTY